MTTEHSDRAHTAAAGAIAGLAGTLAMTAMRAFDRRYAPRTLAPQRHMNKASVTSIHLGYGILAGTVYALIRGDRKISLPMLEAAAAGAVVYAAGPLGSFALAGLNPPPWQQKFPEIAGGLLRYVAFGVTASSVYTAIHSRQ